VVVILRWRVVIESSEFGGLAGIQLPENSARILQISPIPFPQIGRSHDILVQGVEDIFDQTAETLLHVSELAGHLLVLVEGSVSHPHEYQFVGDFVDGFQLLFLQLPDVPKDPEVAHVFCVGFDLVDEVLVGEGVVVAVVGWALAAHQHLLAQQPQVLHLALEVCVLGDVGLVDQVQFCLD